MTPSVVLIRSMALEYCWHTVNLNSFPSDILQKLQLPQISHEPLGVRGCYLVYLETYQNILTYRKYKKKKPKEAPRANFPPWSAWKYTLKHNTSNKGSYSSSLIYFFQRKKKKKLSSRRYRIKYELWHYFKWRQSCHVNCLLLREWTLFRIISCN